MEISVVPDDELPPATAAVLGLQVVCSLGSPWLSLAVEVLAVTAAAVVDDAAVVVVLTVCAAASSAAEVRPSLTLLSRADDAVEAETNLMGIVYMIVLYCSR